MSNKRDYTKCSKPETMLEEDVVIDEMPVENEPELEPEVEVKQDVEPTIGVVSGCTRLNVREDSESNASIVGTIEAGTELVIDMAKSTDDFYMVITAAGIEGFCMKQFITIMP